MSAASTYEQIQSQAKLAAPLPDCCQKTLMSIKDLLELRESLNELYVAAVFYDMFGFALSAASNQGMEGVKQGFQEVAISELKSEIADSYDAPDLATATVSFKRVLKYPLWQTATAHSIQCSRKRQTQKSWRAVAVHFNRNG